jgi:hypothetical protein
MALTDTAIYLRNGRISSRTKKARAAILEKIKRARAALDKAQAA